MDTQMMIEIFGYIGSFLVLVSFLMVSVVKLRVVNTIGSFIFMLYALIIHSYPTAIMNFCLVLINLHFLWKMSKTNQTNKEYDLVRVNKNDAFLTYEINRYKEDIQTCFPDTDLSLEKMNRGYIVCCQGLPVGITFGHEEEGTFDIQLDYSIPEYRDFSIGQYLYSCLPQDGIHTLIYRGDDIHHKAFLEKTGYTKVDNYYKKTL
ncbi:MAG: YgjV family protein [Solobacterium sp.]|nr:YgjV family protein [Solobacterium sp.]